ncbi:hypothetical protein HK104_011463 [Borealophlyctis nickersoniae]|nr:hypothetical protein HK104_011463 [Borealophlyctis nickersoniae]
MKLYQAESGVMLRIRPFDAAESVDALRDEIHSLTSIPPHAQILLTSTGVQMKADMMGEAVADEKGEFVIFVFNRLLLDPRASSVLSSVRGSIEIEPPVPMDVLTPAQNVMRHTVASDQCDAFDAAFRSHFAYGQVWDGYLSFLLAVILCYEQQIQAEALAVALANLQGHSRSVCEAFEVFNAHAQKEFIKHANLLQSFPSDLQALHRIPVHASISDSNQTLADYVPEDKLHAWAEGCRSAHEISVFRRFSEYWFLIGGIERLIRKTAALTETVRSIKAGTEAESAQPADVDFPKLESLLVTVRDCLQKVEATAQVLERDVARAESATTEIGARSSGTQARDKLNALERLFNIHREEYLPEMTKLDRYIRDTVVFFSDSKTHLSHQLVARLQSISHLQSTIASVNPHLNVLTSTLKSHSQAFSQLLHVHRMPPAWGATLVEIVRRKEYVRIFLSKANDMAEVLAKFRSQEEKRRENFRNEISRYLPSGLINGLDDKPPYCEISVSNTKDGLPAITREDIAEFERFVSNIRSSIYEGNPSSDPTVSASAAAPAVSQMQGTVTGGGGGSDSISKLQATMLKMSSQVNAISSEFDKILIKSGLSERFSKLEEENARLRSELTGRMAGGSPSLARAKTLSIGTGDGRDLHPDIRAEEMLKAYEARIKSLERLLQQNYAKMASSRDVGDDQTMAMQSEIQVLRQRVAAQDVRIADAEQRAAGYEARARELEDMVEVERSRRAELERGLEEVNEKAREEVEDLENQLEVAERDRAELARRIEGVEESAENERRAAQAEADKARDFLHEVLEHVDACSRALQHYTIDQGGVGEDVVAGTAGGVGLVAGSPLHQSPLSPRAGTARDEIRRKLRELQDDILCQAAQLASMRDSIRGEDTEGSEVSQSMESELVNLAAEVAGLQAQLASTRDQLTAAEAREAVIEADLRSANALLKRAEEDLASAKERLRVRDGDVASAQERVKSLESDLETTRQSLSAATTNAAALTTEIETLKKTVSESETRREAAERLAKDESASAASSRDHIAELDRTIADVTARLATAQEQLEDWHIVSRLALEQLVIYRDAVVRVGREVCGDESGIPDVVAGTEGGVEGGAGYETGGSETEESADGVAKLAEVLRDVYGKVVGVGAAVDVAEVVERVLEKWRGRDAGVGKGNDDGPRADADKITYTNFQVDDLALFLPTRNPKAWAAFNVNAPHYFLSPAANAEFATEMRNRDWILAFITAIDERTADPAAPGSNPFGLAKGTKFRLCGARRWDGGGSEIRGAGRASESSEGGGGEAGNGSATTTSSGKGTSSVSSSSLAAADTGAGSGVGGISDVGVVSGTDKEETDAPPSPPEM